jgi:hypothetical protein
MVPWFSFETLGLRSKGLASPADHLENLLISVDTTKVIPFVFVQYVPWVSSRCPPNLCPATLIYIPSIYSGKLDHSIYSLYIALFHTVYYILCIYCSHCMLFNSFILFHSAEFPFCLNTLTVDYCWLLCIILIMEIYWRYFDPVTRNCTESQ